MQYIERLLYFQLKKHLTSPEISLILGPRQAGKTTLMEKLQERLIKQNQPTIFLNLDIIEDRQYFSSQHTLFDLIKKKVGSRKSYVFIDEISRLENAGLFLKGLFDFKSAHKFVVTGSGSLELKADVIEPLTGRKQLFYCFPLTFTEFAAFKQNITFSDSKELHDNVSHDLAVQPYARDRLVNEYLNFGGYPQVVLSETETEKTRVLREIYQSYLEKDIGLLLGVEKLYAFENLVKLLAHQAGNIVNRAELSATLGVTEKTVEKYLFYLEKTFVIELVRPFYRNARKELVKSPKVYFSDLGFLYLAQGILPTIARQPMGNAFENACFLRLKEANTIESPPFINPPQFWRTKSGAEVDFVMISAKTGNPVPIEVKTSQGRNIGRSLISFLKAYQPEDGYVYFLKQKDKGRSEKYASATIHFMPYHNLPGFEISL